MDNSGSRDEQYAAKRATITETAAMRALVDVCAAICVCDI